LLVAIDSKGSWVKGGDINSKELYRRLVCLWFNRQRQQRRRVVFVSKS
jgi:hypothetical protein